jgi:dihydrofolate reductase
MDHMRKIIVFTNLTLDGVMQAPGRPEEDRREGFQHGGWGAPYAAMTGVAPDSAAGQALANVGPMLFGRRTYEDFYAYWPKQTGSPYTELLNKAEKYVASTTLKEPLAWENSTLIKGDVAQALASLKEQPGKDFLVFGSGVLIQTLMKHDLVDTYILLIHPLILGAGRRLFPNGSAYASLRLVGSQALPNGVLVATYLPGNR